MDPDPKKILILHASAGDGHRKAAEAMGHAARWMYPNCEVQVVDALDHMPGWFKHSYAGAYLFIIHRVPWLWGLSYDLSDNPIFSVGSGFLRRALNGLFGRRLERFILTSGADVVYSAHFMVSEICSHLKRRGFRTRLVSVITDFLVHRFWVFHETDAYAVASPRTKEALSRFGIPEERIRVTGIPVDPRFSREGDRKFLATKLDVRADRFTMLLTSGGAGTGPMKDVVKRFVDEADIQILAVAGRNEALEHELQEIARGRDNLKVFGFVSNMDELMDCSDVILGKAGGLTLSESLAKRKPFLILSPVPGQETRNAEFLVQCGAAVWIKKLDEISQHVHALKFGKHASLLSGIDAVRKPRAAEEAISIWRTHDGHS